MEKVIINSTGYDVPTSVAMKRIMFCDVTLIIRLTLQPEDGCSTFLLICKLLLHYTMSHLKRQFQLIILFLLIILSCRQTTIPSSLAVIQFPTLYGTRMLITVFTRTHQWSRSWARRIQSVSSHNLFILYIIIRICSQIHTIYFPKMSFRTSAWTPTSLTEIPSYFTSVTSLKYLDRKLNSF